MMNEIIRKGRREFLEREIELKNEMQEYGMVNIAYNIAEALVKVEEFTIEEEYIAMMYNLIEHVNRYAFKFGFYELFITGAEIKNLVQEIKDSELKYKRYLEYVERNNIQN